MRINFNQLDNTDKKLQFTKGVYVVEYNKLGRWVWTDQEFGGIISNIDYMTLSVESQIDNILYCDNHKTDIKKDCYNIIKIKMTNKNEFSVRLDQPFITVHDNRVLGVKIISISVDGEVIF